MTDTTTTGREDALHSDIPMPDGRYTLTWEWTGEPVRQWVARYCGEWLGCRCRESDAHRLILDHDATRMINLKGY